MGINQNENLGKKGFYILKCVWESCSEADKIKNDSFNLCRTPLEVLELELFAVAAHLFRSIISTCVIISILFTE